MSTHVDVLGSAATVVVLGLTLTWLISLARRDASIADIAWGLGFVVVAWTTWSVGDGLDDRRNLLVAMVTIWGIRLAGHLVWRSRGEPEDFRYQSMRRRAGDRFPLTSFFSIFVFQGVVLWVVSLPVQLARFRNDPANEGAVLDWGLWRYTRHPNYFGDCCVWWGLFLVAAETPDARWGVIGPIVMTVMLLRVSGVAMLERGLHKRRDGYADYVERTSAFLPRPPRGPRP